MHKEEKLLGKEEENGDDKENEYRLGEEGESHSLFC
jgi:hypothetical protein